MDPPKAKVTIDQVRDLAASHLEGILRRLLELKKEWEEKEQVANETIEEEIGESASEKESRSPTPPIGAIVTSPAPETAISSQSVAANPAAISGQSANESPAVLKNNLPRQAADIKPKTGATSKTIPVVKDSEAEPQIGNGPAKAIPVRVIAVPSAKVASSLPSQKTLTEAGVKRSPGTLSTSITNSANIVVEPITALSTKGNMAQGRSSPVSAKEVAQAKVATNVSKAPSPKAKKAPSTGNTSDDKSRPSPFIAPPASQAIPSRTETPGSNKVPLISRLAPLPFKAPPLAALTEMLALHKVEPPALPTSSEDMRSRLAVIKERLIHLEGKIGRRLPEQAEPSRHASHWDFVVEEMAWMATDFREERSWKVHMASFLAREAAKKQNHEEIVLNSLQREVARAVSVKVAVFWRSMERLEFLSRSERQAMKEQAAEEKPSSPAQSEAHDTQTGEKPGSSSSTLPLAANKSASVAVNESPLNRSSSPRLTQRTRALAKSTNPEYLKTELATLSCSLLPYQLEALRFLHAMITEESNVIFADEYGLSKATSVVAFLAVYIKEKQDTRLPQKADGQHSSSFGTSAEYLPSLVVVPTSSLAKWAYELQRFGLLGVTVIARNDRSCLDASATSKTKDIVLIDYEDLLAYREKLKSRNWGLLIVEGTKFQPVFGLSSSVDVLAQELGERNVMTKHVWSTVTSLQSNRRVLLYDKEVPADEASVSQWAQLLLPSLTLSGATASHDNASSKSALANITLRRLRVKIGSQIPACKEEIVPCSLTENQIVHYKDYLSSSSLTSPESFLQISLHLRAICNGVDYIGYPDKLMSADLKALEDCSGKLKALGDLLTKLKAEKRRVVLYAQMGDFFDMVELYLDFQGLTYARVIGDQESQLRAAIHYASKEKVFILLMPSRTSHNNGRNALKAFGADVVIILDSDWDPSIESNLQSSWQQMMATTTNLEIYRMYTLGTVEEALMRVGYALTQRLFIEFTPREFFRGGSSAKSVSPSIDSALETSIAEPAPSWWLSITTQELLKAAVELEATYNHLDDLPGHITSGGLIEADHEPVPNLKELRRVEWYALRLIESTTNDESPLSKEQKSDGAESSTLTGESSWLSFNEDLIYDIPDEGNAFAQYELEVLRLRQKGVQPHISLYCPPGMVHENPDKVAIPFRSSQHWPSGYDLVFQKVLRPKPLPLPETPETGPMKSVKLKKLKKAMGIQDSARKRKSETTPELQGLKKKQQRSDSDSFSLSSYVEKIEDEDLALADAVGVKAEAKAHGLPKAPKPGKPGKRKNSEEGRAREAWTTLEDMQIKQAVSTFGMNWHLVSDIVNTRCPVANHIRRRSPRQCLERYQELQTLAKEKKLKEPPRSPQLTFFRGGLVVDYPIVRPPSMMLAPDSEHLPLPLLPSARDVDRRRYLNVYEHVVRSDNNKAQPPSIPGTDDPKAAIAKPHPSHAQAAATAGATKAPLNPLQLVEAKRRAKELASRVVSPNLSDPTLASFMLGSSPLTGPSSGSPALRPSPSLQSQAEAMVRGGMFPDLSAITASSSGLSSLTLQSPLVLTNQKPAAPQGSSSNGGMPVTTSTLLYVIDKMPEIKTQIQTVLQRKDCTEAQKVEMIARLLKSTSQSSGSGEN